MFFVLSKLLELIADPFGLVLIIGVIGVALSFGGRARAGRSLCVAAVVLLLVISFAPLGSMALRPLEDRFPPPADLQEPTGIIVLGGAVDLRLTLARKQPVLNGLASRLTAGVALARRFPNARLIFTGGTARLLPSDGSEAAVVHDLWQSLGVAEARMSFEAKSRNTWENAIYTRALLQPKPGQSWLLVTSAWHMPRAMGLFRRAGFDVIAYPVDYRTFGDSRDFLPIRSGLDQINMLQIAAHEWIGLAAYHMTGKTDTWFPRP